MRAATFKRGRKTPAVKVWLCGAWFRLRMRERRTQKRPLRLLVTKPRHLDELREKAPSAKGSVLFRT